jgi:ADP-heptose:LPS heptosyltransferase
MNRPARFLVIRFSSIGDIVLTTPVLRALKTQIEGGAEVHFLTKKSFASVVESNPYIDKVHTIEIATAEVIDELKDLHFDYIIDLHSNIRSTMVKRNLKILDFTFKKLNIEKWLLVNFGVDKMPKTHIVDRYMDTLKAFGVHSDGQGLDYFIPQSEEVTLGDELLHGYLCIAAGAAHIGKRIPTETLVDVCKTFHGKVVIVGGNDDIEVGNTLAGIAPDRIFNEAGKRSIHASASIIRQSSVVLAGDTGMMHIAAAFKRPLVSVWGCTVPELGMSPYGDFENIILEPKNLSKRPCSKLGDRCKYEKTGRCITHIPASEILNAINRLLLENRL